MASVTKAEEEKSSVLSFGKNVFWRFPKRVSLVLFLLALAAFLEIFSMAVIVPVLMTLMGQEEGSSSFAQNFAEWMPVGQLSLMEGLIVLVSFMTIRGIFIFMTQYQVGLISTRIERSLREELMDAHLKGHWNYHQNLNVGHFTNTITQQVTLCSNGVLQFGQFFSATVLALILLMASLVISWKAFLIFVLSCIPYLYLSKRLNASTHHASKSFIAALGECTSHAMANLDMAKYLKASALEENMMGRFKENTQKLETSHMGLIRNNAILYSYPEVFGVLTLAILISVMHHYGAIAPESLIFFLLVMYRAYIQLSRMQSNKNTLVRQIPSYQKIVQFMGDAKGNEEIFKGEPYQSSDAETLFETRGLKVTYGPEAIVLNDVSLSIPNKKVVGLVGRSGAGKTSLVDSLIGLLNAEEGNIILGAQGELDAVNLQSFRKRIGYVPQECFLLPSTVRDNVLLGAEDVSEEHLKQVAELAQISDFIGKLEKGFDTEVADRGNNFSGGQKQRIALARALARKPDVLIMDEATSALDNETEKTIQNTIASLKDTMSVILIAHRLTTVRNADIIYVFDQGKLVETGDYDSLLKQKGYFYNLHSASET